MDDSGVSATPADLPGVWVRGCWILRTDHPDALAGSATERGTGDYGAGAGSRSALAGPGTGLPHGG
jgi:hypothetical protein